MSPYPQCGQTGVAAGFSMGDREFVEVFGSVARDEATSTSDVDVVVEFDGPTTFDGYFEVKERLERGRFDDRVAAVVDCPVGCPAERPVVRLPSP